MDTKNVQMRLMLADRMVSLGTLAAGVAHEINNPLAYVLGNLDYVTEAMTELSKQLRSTGGDATAQPPQEAVEALLGRLDELCTALKEARGGADRVSNIVRDLNTFSRGDEDVRGPVDVRRVMESAVNMTRNQVKHRARLLRDYKDVPFIEANEARIGQVFLNLLMNAVQAIPDGAADRNEISLVTRTDAQGYVVTEVHDTGCGIPAENMPRLFDPFFTTKPVGEGTGLGLAICHGVVNALGGQIHVDSRAGVGTVVRVVLPPSPSQKREVPPRPDAAEPHRRGRVLVVEDEEVVGASVRRLLSNEHDVLLVTHGRQALRVITEGASFDVILCDLMMPEMSGMDLHEELTKAAPQQAERMVFLTGGAFTPRARSFLATVRNERLDKPFDAGALRAIIRSVMARPVVAV